MGQADEGKILASLLEMLYDKRTSQTTEWARSGSLLSNFSHAIHSEKMGWTEGELGKLIMVSLCYIFMTENNKVKLLGKLLSTKLF